MTQTQKTRPTTERTTDQSVAEAKQRDVETQALLDKADELMADIEDSIDEAEFHNDEAYDLLDSIDEDGELLDHWGQLLRKLEQGKSPCGCGGFAMFLTKD